MNISAIELINTIKNNRKEKDLSQFEIAKIWKIDLAENNKIKCGYDVFGKEYGFMLRNDLHDN